MLHAVSAHFSLICTALCSVKILPMPKIILYAAVSLDGYLAGPNHELDWLRDDPDYDGYEPFIAGIDTLVMGRRTWDVLAGFGEWPYGERRAYVMSQSLEKIETDLPVTVTKQSPSDLIESLRQDAGNNKAKIGDQDAKDIWLVGGGLLVRSFLAADLIDEMILSMQPVLLGHGLPLFPAGFPQRWFERVRVSHYPKGMVETHWRRSRE